MTVELQFRYEYGRLVALLSRRVGIRNLDFVEDAVQHALMAALGSWGANGMPDEPAAWLYRVAFNHLLGELRKQGGRARILERSGEELLQGEEPAAPAFFDSEIRDEMLRMLFFCCDESIPNDSRLVLALKTLCGFSTREIALRLFTSEANVHKRLARARDRMREIPPDFQTLPLQDLAARIPGVRTVLYLLFNEGYLSTQAEQAIRIELCGEAMRLATLLAEHPVGANPETFALLALMNLHAARLPARLDDMGGLMLLEEQDRSLWDRERMAAGAGWLERSAGVGTFTRYHAEAGIAAEHCFAPSYGQTRWKEIADLYAMLERIEPSPLHAMHRAVAVAEWQGPEAGLAVLGEIDPPPWLTGYYLWHAVLGDLNRRAGEESLFRHHFGMALELAPSDAERTLLRRRMTSS